MKTAAAGINLETVASVSFGMLVIGLAVGLIIPTSFALHGLRGQAFLGSLEEKPDKKSNPRRDFLKLTLMVGGIAGLASIASPFRILTYIPPPSNETYGKLSWPRIKLVNISALTDLQPLRFNYPLVDTPNVMVKLGANAEGAVGPNSDIVAYSVVCQHLGCVTGFLTPGTSPLCDKSFSASTPQGFCCCHGGQYDYLHRGKVIGGPPPYPVPPVLLEYDSATGDIYAVGMGGPTLFGHGPGGVTDPAQVLQYDLQGGDIVTEVTVFKGT